MPMHYQRILPEKFEELEREACKAAVDQLLGKEKEAVETDDKSADDVNGKFDKKSGFLAKGQSDKKAKDKKNKVKSPKELSAWGNVLTKMWKETDHYPLTMKQVVSYPQDDRRSEMLVKGKKADPI